MIFSSIRLIFEWNIKNREYYMICLGKNILDFWYFLRALWHSWYIVCRNLCILGYTLKSFQFNGESSVHISFDAKSSENKKHQYIYIYQYIENFDADLNLSLRAFLKLPLRSHKNFMFLVTVRITFEKHIGKIWCFILP